MNPPQTTRNGAVSKKKIAIVAAAALLGFIALLSLLAIIGFQFYRWHPTVFAAPTSNVIPSGTYDFTYAEQFGPDNKIVIRTDATGRIKLAPGACELNSVAKQWSQVFPDRTDTFEAVRPTSGPTFVRTDSEYNGDKKFHDTRQADSSVRMPMTFFAPLFAGQRSDAYGSFCSLGALEALTTTGTHPGDRDLDAAPFTVFRSAATGEFVEEWLTALGVPEPQFSITARMLASVDSSGSPALNVAQMAPTFHVTTNPDTHAVTVTTSNGARVAVTIVLTPTTAKVNTRVPRGTVSAFTETRAAMKAAGGVNEYMKQLGY